MGKPFLPKAGNCTARSSRTGQPCRKKAIRGGKVCRTHGGAAKQVKAAADKRVRDMLAEAIDPDRVLREAGRIAYSDIRQVFDGDGNLLPIKDWPEDVARAVAGVEVVKRNLDSGDGELDDVIKIKLWDKVVMVTNLMKHHGQLAEKVDLTIGGNLVDRLMAGRKRVADHARR